MAFALIQKIFRSEKDLLKGLFNFELIFAHHNIVLRIFSHLVKGELVAVHVDKKRLIRVEDGAGRVPVQRVDRLA